MKTHRLLPLLAGLALAASLAGRLNAGPVAAADNVSVTFQDPDKFTDVRENNSTTNSTYYLDELKACLKETAALRLAAGQKLNITVTDVDLAGENLFNQPNRIRIYRQIDAPRVKLKFQLLAADGTVLKEGTRNLTDTYYLNNLRLPGSQDPLYYDKQLLIQWVRDEFRAKT